ncbi:MAG: Na+/H+ antiporter [Chitinophagaceae bacterium]|nr:MAG: Na+/H+ antiporter [Chitinophagaceae bacterium]
MIQDNLLLILSLLFTISMLTMISSRVKIPYPIFLVIGGILISLIPGIPNIALDPELVFLIFLPPLLYAAAWNTSWKEFWRLRRAISMLGFGLVIFTSAAVALVSHAIIPDFPLAFGFLLGGIISPPDAVAATSVLQGLKAPKRVVTILEGESLVNDAASLIVFRFAVAAILTGQFAVLDASRTFFLVAGMGIAIGLAIAFVIFAIHRFLPTTPAIDAGISLISPYIMYVAAEHFHFSGVLSVVTGGLFLTYHSHKLFSYESRLNLLSLWDTLIFLLNGFVFILIGLELPVIIDGLGDYSVSEAIIYALIISLVTIVIRIVWVFPGAYLPRMLSRKIREKENNPGWKATFLVAWSGMRGVVSLASALAVPLFLTNGEAFPHRNLILFITFVVIIITLVLQGLSLRPLIRVLDIQENEKDGLETQSMLLRIQLAETVLSFIDTNYSEQVTNIETYKRVRDRYERMIEVTKKRLENEAGTSDDDPVRFYLPMYRRMLVEVVDVRRQELNRARVSGEYSEELIRERERELDLEEARLKTMKTSG